MFGVYQWFWPTCSNVVRFQMSSQGGSKSGASNTRKQAASSLSDNVGPAKEFLVSEVLTMRTIIQRGILLREVAMIENWNGDEYGDGSVRPRITPKINLSATSLKDLISWAPGEVKEPVFTSSRSTAEIKTFLDTPFDPPPFSCHTQSTERWYDDRFLDHFNFCKNQGSCNGDQGSCNCLWQGS